MYATNEKDINNVPFLKHNITTTLIYLMNGGIQLDGVCNCTRVLKVQIYKITKDEIGGSCNSHGNQMLPFLEK